MVIGGKGYDTIRAYRIVDEEQYNKIEENIFVNNKLALKDRNVRKNGKSLIRIIHKEGESAEECVVHIYLKKNRQVSVHVSLPKLVNKGCNVNLLNYTNVSGAIGIINRMLGLDQIKDCSFESFRLTRIDIATNLMLDISPHNLMSIPAPNYFRRAAAFNETVYFIATNKRIEFQDLRSIKSKREIKYKLKKALDGFKRQFVIYEKEIKGYKLSALRLEARIEKNRIIESQLRYDSTVGALKEEEFYIRCIGYFDKLISSILSKKYKGVTSILGKAYKGET